MGHKGLGEFVCLLGHTGLGESNHLPGCTGLGESIHLLAASPGQPSTGVSVLWVWLSDVFCNSWNDLGFWSISCFPAASGLPDHLLLPMGLISSLLLSSTMAAKVVIGCLASA